MVSRLLLFEWNCQGVESLLVVDGCLQVEEPLQEEDLTGARNSRLWMGTTQCTHLVGLADGISVRLPEEATTFREDVLSCGVVSSVITLLPLDESWKLLPTY